MYSSDDSSDSDSGTSFKRGKRSKFDEDNKRSPKKDPHRRHSNVGKSSSDRRDRDRSDHISKQQKANHEHDDRRKNRDDVDRKRHREDLNDDRRRRVNEEVDKKRQREADDRKQRFQQRERSDERRPRRSAEREVQKHSSSSSSGYREAQVARDQSKFLNRNDRQEDLRKKQQQHHSSNSDGTRSNSAEPRRKENQQQHSNEKRLESRKEPAHHASDIKQKSDKHDKNSKQRDNKTPPHKADKIEQQDRYRKEKKSESKRSNSPATQHHHSRNHSRHASSERDKERKKIELKPVVDDDDDDDDDYDAYGPALPPPSKAKTPERRYACPEIPQKHSRERSERKIGPLLPKDFTPSAYNDSEVVEENYDRISSDEEEIIGPTLAKQMTEHQLELEKRKIQLKIEELDRRTQQIKTDQREEWMTVLPDVRKVPDLGLGARQFRRGDQPDFSDRSSWTKTPNDGDEKHNKNKPDDPHRSMEKRRHDEAIAKRDAEQEEIARKHKKVHKRDKSLLEIHEKKLKKEKKKAKDEKPERKPFSRETDLQVNRFDESRKKAAIKSSQLLDDRFSRGQRKFL